MEEFNVIAKCIMCGKEKQVCTEVIKITQQGGQKVETWCKSCYKDIKEEINKQREELENYKWIWR